MNVNFCYDFFSSKFLWNRVREKNLQKLLDFSIIVGIERNILLLLGKVMESISNK